MQLSLFIIIWGNNVWRLGLWRRVTDTLLHQVKSYFDNLDSFQKLVRSQSIQDFQCLINNCSHILIPIALLSSLDTSSTVWTITGTLASIFLWIKNFEYFHMKISAAIGLIDDFSLDGSSINLRIFIVNIVSKLLEVLSGVRFELWVSEHVAYFFEMIGRLKPNESTFLLFISSRPFNFFFIIPLAKIDSSSGSGRAATALLAQIWKVSGDNEAQISEAVPHVKLGCLFLRSFMLLDFAKLRADNLDKDFIFLKETRLELKHWSNSLGDWINSTLLVCQNVIIVFVDGLHQADVLDIIL